MKVLHIITSLTTGGAERTLYKLLSAGLADNFDSEVLSLRDEGSIGEKIRLLGVPVHTLNIRERVPGVNNIVHLHKIIHKLKPDIIQGWMYHGNLVAFIAGMLSQNNPEIFWNIRHSLYNLSVEKPLTRQIIRANKYLSGKVEVIIYNSNVSRNQHESFGFRKSRSKVIPNGFDTEKLKPNKKTGLSVREELGISKNVLVVGHVARFHPMKDHISFIEAATAVATQMPNVHFLLVGRDVTLKNSTLSAAVPHEIINKFTFLGERQDIHQIMHVMDVLTVSSAWGEAFPNVLGEAMACGVPCVATDIGDSSLLIGDTGIVVSPSDSKALARVMLSMLKKPEEEQRNMGIKARERIEKNYSLHSIVNTYKELYNSIAGKK